MFQNISWSAYLAGCGALSAIYYTAVWFRYFRKDLATGQHPGKMTVRPSANKPNTLFPQDRISASPPDKEQAPPDLSHHVHDLVDELRALLAQSAAEHNSKEELARMIHQLLKKYPALKGSHFQPPITNLIAVETERNCQLRFDAEELAAFWN
jgi:hypothetical protein